jgi:hypothetical protein
MIRGTKIGVTMMNTGGVPVGTRLAVAEIKSLMNWNSMMRGTKITMAPAMTSLNGSTLLKDDTFQEASMPILET